jgi:hypothetical protein
MFDWINYFIILYNTTGWLLSKCHLFLFKYEIKSISCNVVYMWHCYLFWFHVMHIYLFQDSFLTRLFINGIRTKNISNEFRERVTWDFEIRMNWNYNFNHVSICIVDRKAIKIIPLFLHILYRKLRVSYCRYSLPKIKHTYIQKGLLATAFALQLKTTWNISFSTQSIVEAGQKKGKWTDVILWR